jgi:hypothetical protein
VPAKLQTYSFYFIDQVKTEWAIWEGFSAIPAARRSVSITQGVHLKITVDGNASQASQWSAY